MLIPIVYNKGLPKEVLHNIELRNYSEDELFEIHQQIKESYTNKKNGFSLAAVLVIACAFFVILLGIMGSEQGSLTVIAPFGGVVFAVIVAITFLRKNIVNKSKNQFIRTVEKSYPELAGKFDKNSFK